MPPVRIMGIDPGISIAGFAFIEAKKPAPLNPKDFSIIEVGVLRSRTQDDAWLRIGMMHESMFELIREFRPKICVMESIFLGKNVRSALTLGQIRGAFISAATRCNATISELSPTTVKKVISGNGHAAKEDVHKALQALIGFNKGQLPYDASDALAIALCFSLRAAWQSKWPNNAFPYDDENIKIPNKGKDLGKSPPLPAKLNQELDHADLDS